MEEDVSQGLIPFYVSCTLGTTSAASFDNLVEIAQVVKQYTKPCRVWLHVDGAYAGNSFICPEYRKPAQGLENADSIDINPNKWLLTAFDTTCLWLKNRNTLTEALSIEPLYLKHEYEGQVIDYRNWGVPLSRRFRSLKLWFTIRLYGLEGLRKYIRNHVNLARYFESLMLTKPDRYEITNEVKVSTLFKK